MKHCSQLLKSSAKLVLLIGIFLLISSTSAKSAQAKIGTHLGYGDVNHQLSLMDMLAANGADAGFPITILIRPDIDQQQLINLATRAQGHNFFIIIRIDGVCHGGSQTRDIVDRVNQIFSERLGDDYIITYGNEVNNQEVECPDWNTYASNYGAVKGKGKISPSALDWYNPDYPASSFLNQTNLKSDYHNASFRTANAYGCINQTASDCNPFETDTHYQGMTDSEEGQRIPGSKLYLTEFSLSPGGGDSAPDTNLNNVVDFIETQGPNTGAVHITPLIRNVCSGVDGDWLLYLHGKMFGPDGTKVTSQNCEDYDGKKNYSRNKNTNDYITYPLVFQRETTWRQDKTGPEESSKDKFVYNMVANQGYEAYCASPKLYITHEVFGAYRRFLEILEERAPINESNPFVIGGGGTEEADLTDSRIPIFRGIESSDLTKKNSSYEGFFGAVNPEYDLNSPGDPIESGAANSLLSLEQQCRVKYNNLVTAKKLCEVTKEPELCALHQKILNHNNQSYYLFSTDKQHTQGELSLLKELNSAYNTPLPACDELSRAWQPDFKVKQDTHEVLQKALANMSLNLDKVYRLAFLVISVHQDINEFGSVKDPEDPFWLLEKWQKNIYKTVPMFIAFKIPDFGTNRTKELPFLDTAQLSTNAITKMPAEDDEGKTNWFDVDSLSKEEETRRSKFLEKIEEKALINETGSQLMKASALVINCLGLPQCDGAHGAGVDLRRALVDIVNGTSDWCDNFDNETSPPKHIINDTDHPNPLGVVEKAGDIYTPGLFTMPESREFKPGYGDQVEDSTHSHNYVWGLKFIGKDRASELEDPNDKTVRVPITVHIVAPSGSNLTVIERSLAALFADEELETMIKENRIADSEGRGANVPRFFPMPEGDFKFESIIRKPFHDPDKADQCPCEDEDADFQGCKRIDCDNNEFQIKLSDNNVGLFIKGAKLGWFIRKIQETTREFGTKAYDYLRSCERVEDMFLGRCGTDDRTVYGPPDGLPYNGSGTYPDDLKCKPIEDPSSPCSINNLKTSLANYIKVRNNSEELPITERELEIRAIQASIVCRAESGGSPNAKNDGCLTGKTVDYSLGLFQINLLAHECPEYFDYTWKPPSCNILVEQSKVSACADRVLKVENNLKHAWRISNGGINWRAWGVAREQYCGPSIERVRQDN